MNEVNRKSLVKQWDGKAEIVVPKRTFDEFGLNEFVKEGFHYVPEFNSHYYDVERQVEEERFLPVVESVTTNSVRSENDAKKKPMDKRMLAAGAIALALLLG